MEGTNTFYVIIFEDIPRDIRKEIFHSMVVCEVRHQKEYSDRKHITAAVSRIYYPGNIVTPTGSLDLFKLMVNSVLSRRNACFVYFDEKIFYLQTPMYRPEYVRIKLLDIPQ